MNKKSILISSCFTVMVGLLIAYAVALDNKQQELFIHSDISGYTWHLMRMEYFENGMDPLDFKNLITEHEDRWCEIVKGTWNKETRECRNITDYYCLIITGTMQSRPDGSTVCIIA